MIALNMSTCNGTVPPSIELRAFRGVHCRTLTITAITDRSLASKAAPPPHFATHADVSSIIDHYAFAVAVGCFGDAPFVSVDEIGRTIKGVTETTTFALDLQPLPLEALGPLITKARHANTFGGSLAHLIVEERNPTAPPNIDVLALGSLPAPDLYFSVELPRDPEEELKGGRITVTFRNAVEVGTISRAQGAFEGWAGVLMGGYETKRGCSTGIVTAVSHQRDTVVEASLESANASKDAWHALLRALDVVHREVQEIQHVRLS